MYPGDLHVLPWVQRAGQYAAAIWGGRTKEAGAWSAKHLDAPDQSSFIAVVRSVSAFLELDSRAPLPDPPYEEVGADDAV